MELNEFRAKVYEILEKHGHIEKDGQLYYPESAIIEAMEYLYSNFQKIPIEFFEAKLAGAMASVIDQLFSQGRSDEKQ